ncbi:MAG: Ig-like domain-containing protein, partial [Treponema sp.]|nr:Ig-like domain-containing protein [Treponema sp.]
VAGCDSSGGTGSHYQERTINASSGLTAESLELFADLSVSKAEAFSAVNVTVISSGAKVRVWADTDVVSFIENPEEIAESWIVKFKPNRQGEFTVNAESGSVKKTVTIKVTSKLSSITVTGSADPIDVGKTVQLKANKNPSDSPAAVTWASSDEKVATVDQNGLVTAKSAGVATITATSTDTETDTYNGADIVSGYFDVTVKGFYLSDTSFFLCQKDTDDEVEAKLVGIGDGTVTWTPDASGVFTVTVDPSDNKKAKLNYKDGADGQGKLTVTVTVAGKTYEATADVYVHKFYMLALGDSIAAGYAPKKIGEGADDKDLEEPDMLEAYNKYMNRRKDQSVDPNYVNEYAYPAVLKTKLTTSSNVTLHSYAMSGDNTTMLLDKLKDNYRDGTIATKQGEIMEAVKQADFITLCIGANDILLKVFGTDLITKTPEQFKTMFEDEVPGFKKRFDQIIATLTANGQQVYVMSIFSPYKYFKSRADGGFIPDDKFSGFYKSWINKIVKINAYAEPVITQINEHIKSVAASNANVTFVDVAPMFDNMGNDDHKKNLHPVPERMDFTKLIAGMGKQIPIWFDPHPTKAGAVKIADAYKGKFTTTP